MTGIHIQGIYSSEENPKGQTTPLKEKLTTALDPNYMKHRKSKGKLKSDESENMYVSLSCQNRRRKSARSWWRWGVS